jgi:thymidylate synthase
MRSIAHSNVNGAFYHGVHILVHEGLREQTRAGPVLVHPLPVTNTYRQPTQRVLFSRARRANPFFHLFEAFWMLAGREDAAFLDQYVHDFGSRFAEDDGNLHGAYGYRWRHHFGLDQLKVAVSELRRDPASRRIVIGMWDPAGDLAVSKLDIPCNSHIYLRMQPKPDGGHTLDMTVCCRSNDAIWGLYGANAVHFSVLQEYLAHWLKADVGALYTLSNNFHVYESTLHLWDKDELGCDPYSTEQVNASPLFAGCLTEAAFHYELLEWLKNPEELRPTAGPAFRNLLVPMARVHAAYKRKGVRLATELLGDVRHEDWRAGAALWLSQRRGPGA